MNVVFNRPCKTPSNSSYTPALSNSCSNFNPITFSDTPLNPNIAHPDQENLAWLERFSQNTNVRETIHFSPANGLPVASYTGLFECFDEKYHVSGMDFRGSWPDQALPARSFTWQHHADDLISAIEKKHTQPIIGMGHSLGATVTLLAAVKRPELFSKIIAIEPATIPSANLAIFYKHLPQWLVFKLVPFIRKTHDRQRIWSSPQAFYDKYRTHPTYRLFTDRALKDYAQYGLKQRPGGDFELAHDPTWESFNFRRAEYLWDILEKCRLPTLVLRAEHSYLYSQLQFDQRNTKLAANIQPQTIPGAHHLVSHELPDLVADQILNWL
ncbi:MAG: pimeloyl-ACP methyl ester carboxylesterase [Arenicella sp.]